MEQNENAAISYVVPDQRSEIKKIEERPGEINILVAIPTNKYIEPATFKSIFDLKVPSNVKLHFEYFFGYMVDQVRNLAVEWGKNYDYTFFVDSDISFDESALIRLLSLNKDVSSGVYVQRKTPMNITEVYVDTPRGQENLLWTDDLKYKVMEVSAVGMGCCLIKGNVLRSMHYPHFYYTSAVNHAHAISEDTYFCNKVKAMGMQIWVDFGVICQHHGDHVFSPMEQKEMS